MTIAIPTQGARPTLRASTRRFLAWLPPVRLLWIALIAIGLIGVGALQGLGLPSLVLLPIVAVGVDLLFQRVRFPRLRFPDAALATGLFLALIFPPSAPLLLTGVATVAAVAIRHALRFQGRPWFNPAALGTVIGVLLLGLAPAWWVAIGPTGEYAMLTVGGLLLARNWRAWRLPLSFFAAYGVLSLVQHLMVGASTAPNVLLLTVVDPVVLFFGLFMIVEPRSSPALPYEQPLFGGVVGVAAALLPTVLPSLGILLALLLGNGLALVMRRAPVAEAIPAKRPAAAATRRPNRRRAGAAVARPRWPVAYRIAAGVLTVVLVGAVAGAGHLTFGPIVQVQAPGGSGSLSGCQSDNPSIPASTLAALHKALGPSVILSYSSGTGVVVFYDPVNQVTVTESDLYEDFGYAEFNGDDYAVSGCAG